MVNFIKLTSVIINTSKINKIIIKNNKYCIYLSNFNSLKILTVLNSWHKTISKRVHRFKFFNSFFKIK